MTDFPHVNFERNFVLVTLSAMGTFDILAWSMNGRQMALHFGFADSFVATQFAEEQLFATEFIHGLCHALLNRHWPWKCITTIIFFCNPFCACGFARRSGFCMFSRTPRTRHFQAECGQS